MTKLIIYFLAGMLTGWIAGSSHKHRGGEIPPPVTLHVITDTLTITKPEPTSVRRSAEVIRVEVHDTVLLLQREEKIYTDSSSYRAVVSGYDVRLDTLSLLRREVHHLQPRRHWGIGISTGITATPKGLYPGITLGLTYMF